MAIRNIRVLGDEILRKKKQKKLQRLHREFRN